MARIRTIKPEFWSSKTLAKVSRESRLTFIGLWSLCDDLGITLDTPKKIAGDLYPYEDIAGKEIDEQLNELQSFGLLLRISENNKDFIIITSWDEHQKVDRPSKFSHLSRESRDKLAIGSGKREAGSGKREAGNGKRETGSPPNGDDEKKPKPNPELDLLTQHGVEGKVAKDFLTTRKKKLTETAMDGIVREANIAGISVLAAITICAERGWQGFNASWDWNGKTKINGNHGPPITPKGIMPKIDYGPYVPSKEKMDAMKTIDGEVIRESV